MALVLVCGATSPSARGAAPAPIALVSARNDVSPLLRDLSPTRPPPTPDVGRTGGGSLVGPIQSFEGVGNGENSGNPAASPPISPPDAVGDVGPRHYVQWVNSALAVYDKVGNRLLGPLPGNMVWSGFGGVCETSNKGDPVVLYDQLADRWVLTQFASAVRANNPEPPYLQCLAVSTTPDPTGSYYRYAFAMPDGLVNDYAKLAVWTDGYYMTDNRTMANGQSVGAGAFAFDRAAMLAGNPARGIYFQLGPQLVGILPTDLEGRTPPARGTPETFVRADDDAFGFPDDQLELWRFSADFGRPGSSRLDGPILLPVATFDSRLCATPQACVGQPETMQALDGRSDRLLFRATYRSFGSYSSLVAMQTVDVGSDHAGIRWYEVRDPAGAALIRQQGTYAPDSDHRWMGSAAMDGAGDIALAFSVSGSSTFPSIGYTGRLAGDPLSTLPGLEGEGRLVTGAGSQTGSNRWGDYSSLSVDPADDCTFWYTQEYYPVSSAIGWHTRIGSFKFPGCGATPTLSGQAREGQTLRAEPGNWTQLPGASFAYQWRRCDARGATCADIPGATGTAYVLSGADVDSTVRVVVTADSAAGVASALSAATPLVTPVPAAGSLDLTLRLAVTSPRVKLGARVLFSIDVGNASTAGSATGVVLTDVLPAGAALVSAVPDRGPGCEGTTTVVCPLDFLPGGRTATIRIRVRMTARGRLTDTVSVRADQGEVDPATNEASALVTVRGPPRIALVGRRPFSARAAGDTVILSARLSIDEPARLTARALDRRGRSLPLLAGSMLGGKGFTRRRTALTIAQPVAGAVPLLLKLPLQRVRRRRVYRLAIQAVDADGETGVAAASFRRR